MHDFSVFFKRFNELCGNCSRVWTKIQIVENSAQVFPIFSNNLTNPALNFCAFGRRTLFSGNFEKILKNLKKIAKNALFQHIYQKNLTDHALIFCAFGRKTQLLGNFEKIFENLRKFSKENCEKRITLAYEILRKFSKNFLRKLRKSYYFSIFFKKLTNHGKYLARLEEKVNLLEILRNFSKFQENFLKKIAKNT